MLLRTLTAVALAAGPWLLPAPAGAAGTVTIEASRTVLDHGDTVTFTGRTLGVTPGVLVRLQRKASDGWSTVDTARTSSTRAYRLRTRPPRGYQDYRVLQPRQDGQSRAVSATSTLTVRWRPVVTGAVTELVRSADGYHVTRLSGSADALAGTSLLVQRRADTGWTSTGATTPVRDDGRYRQDFTDEPVGTDLRLLAPASGARRAAASPVATIVTAGWHPTIEVDTSGFMRDDDVWVTRVTGRADRLPGVALDVQQLVGDTWTSTGDVATVGSGGAFVHDFDAAPRGASYRFHAAADGERLAADSATVTVEDVSWRPTVAVTSALPVHETTDGGHVQRTRLVGTSDAPGATVSFLASTPDRPWLQLGQGTTGPDGSFDVLVPAAPDGAEVTAVLPEQGPRLEARSEPVVAHLEPWPITVGDDWFGLSPVLGETGGLLTFEAGAGDVITFEIRDPDPSTYDPVSYRILGPDGAPVAEQRRDVDGSVIRWLETPTAGTYTIALDMGENHTFPGQVELRATAALQLTGSIDAMPYVSTARDHQVAEITFTGSAGEAFHLPTGGVAGSCRDHYTSGPYVELLHDGAVVAPAPVATAWELPADGSYTLRLYPCERWYQSSSMRTWLISHRPQLVRPAAYDLALPGTVTVQPGKGHWGRVAFDAAAGDSVTLEATDWNEVFSRYVVAPDGQVLGTTFTAPVTGTYHLWLGPAPYDSSYITVRGSRKRA